MKISFISSMNPHDDIRIYRKFILSLVKSNDIIYYHSSLNENEINHDKVKFINLGKTNSKLNRILKLIFIVKKIKSSEIFIITNPELLLISPVIKYKFPRSKIMFDMHEDFEEAFQDKSKKFGKIFSKIYINLINYLVNQKILNHIFVTTPLIYNKFKHLPNVDIIENYAPIMNIDFNNRQKQNDKNFELLFHGSISKIRGIDVLLNAMPYLEGVRLHLVGKFTVGYKEEILQRIIELQIRDKVIVMDSIDYNGLFEYMKNMHVGIISYLPYKNHLVTRPNKLFEYMAASMPVICSDFPLYSEVVSNRCGLTYNPESKEEFIECVNKLKNNKDLYNLFSRNGYNDYIEKYNWSIEEKKLLEIINNGG